MADLDSGTGTVLFTDIEGNTKRWERDRQVMTAAVAEHIALLDVRPSRVSQRSVG